MELARQLEAAGAAISALGMRILPYSFALYMPVRWLEFVWKRGYTRLVKATWYAALGTAYLVGSLDTVVIVTYICFIEACDLVFQQLETARGRQASRAERPVAPATPSATATKDSRMAASGGFLWAWMARLLSAISGEFLPRRRPNSGTVVLVRSLLSALAVYLTAIGIHSRLQPGSTWRPSWHEFRLLTANTLPWFGAIFAVTYAALYSRFSSQWTYLANLYNSIMTAQIQAPRDEDNCRAYAAWMAGFIEDAEELHLALKPIYASVILSLLEKPGVREMYATHTPGGKTRLANLEAQLCALQGRERARREHR